MSKGVTLYYFESKDELFRDLFSWLIDSIHERMREAVAREEDPVGKVRALVAMIFPSPSKNRAFFRAFVDFCGLAARHERFREVNARFYAGCREIDGGIAEEGMRRGVFAVRDPREAGSTMRAIFDGLMMQWLRKAIRRRPSAPTGSAARGSSSITCSRASRRREEENTMNAQTTRRETPAERCASEACPRPAESGEAYCADCGLERSLYFRDRREDRGEIRADALRDTARR